MKRPETGHCELAIPYRSDDELDKTVHELRLDKDCTCAETRALAAQKLVLIKQKMADLAALQDNLVGLVEQCDTGDGGANCPIIDVLEHD
jgi:MerR family mercuric resistance operon transcriptional regulator